MRWLYYFIKDYLIKRKIVKCPECGGLRVNEYSYEPYLAYRCICTYSRKEVKKMMKENKEKI